MINRYFVRSLGIVIPETAFSAIEFSFSEYVKYKFAEMTDYSANPMVVASLGAQIRATIHIEDPSIIQLLKEEDEDDEDEDEEEEAPKRGRGRPAKKKAQEKEEKPVEPFAVNIIYHEANLEGESVPLNESRPLLRRMEGSTKNATVLNQRMDHLATLIYKLNSVRDNLSRETERVSEELEGVTSDLIPDFASRTMNIEATALEEYRSRQRNTETELVGRIQEAYQFFVEKVLDKASESYDFEPLTGDIDLGSTTINAVDMVNKFFKEEFIRIA